MKKGLPITMQNRAQLYYSNLIIKSLKGRSLLHNIVILFNQHYYYPEFQHQQRH